MISDKVFIRCHFIRCSSYAGAGELKWTFMEDINVGGTAGCTPLGQKKFSLALKKGYGQKIIA